MTATENNGCIVINILEDESREIIQAISDFDITKEEFISFLNNTDFSSNDDIGNISIPPFIKPVLINLIKMKIQEFRSKGLL